MVWVEQPVGVGFTQGVPNITNEVELAQEFIGFYRNFVDAFDMQSWKVYLTGESYGGFYVPYIADAFINQNDTVYYNLAGVAINDPILGDSTVQQQGQYLWTPLFDALLTLHSGDCPICGLLVQPLLPELDLQHRHPQTRRRLRLHRLPRKISHLPPAPNPIPRPAQPLRKRHPHLRHLRRRLQCRPRSKPMLQHLPHY